jgi:3-oxoadipate enol-lactonase
MTGASIEFDHGGTHVRIDGPADAPVVVLVHALSTDLTFWDMQVPVWASRYRVVRFDIRGHGRSQPPQGTYGFDEMADEVIRLLDHLNVQKAGFVGLSLGGMVGQCLGIKAPHRFSALVLAETNARTPDNLKDMWRQRITAVTGGGMETQVEGSVSRWFTPEFRAQAPLTVEWIAGLVRRTHPLGFMACCRAIENLDYFDRLGEIKVPTLALAGANDMAAPPANLQAIANQIAGAEFAVVDRAAHLGNIEQPVAFAEIVGAFLAKHVR